MLFSLSIASKDFKKAICSLSEVSFNGINGKGEKAIIPEWSGTITIKTTLEKTKQIADAFSSNYASSFLLFNQIVANAQEFEDLINYHETNYGLKTLQSPSFASTNQIIPTFLNSYSPIISPEKTLYKILNEYLTNIKPSVNILIQIENNAKHISTSSTQIKVELDKTIIEIENLELAFQVIDDKLISKIILVHDILIDIILVLYQFSLSFMVVIVGTIIIFLSFFKFKYIMGIKYLLHVLWNINFVFIAFSFIVCAFLGIFGIISHDIIVTINYMLSPSYMETLNSILSFQLNTVKHVNTCLNSDGDLSRSINIVRGFYDYFDFVYLRSFTLYELDNQIRSITQSNVISVENEKYIKYQNNIPLTTDDNFGKDDVTESLYQLSRWTDTGLTDSLQPPCVTKTYDHWVANVNQCPLGYVYSPSGRNLKNCLLIPNWTKQAITNRYNSACDTIGGVPIAIGARQHFDPLLDYYTSCSNLLNSILSGNQDFSNRYKSLLSNIKEETQNIKPLLDSIQSLYEPIVSNNTIYQLFNCTPLKNKLILFYDQLSNHYYNNCVAIVVMTILSLLMSYAGNYFFVDVIYRHENIMYEEGYYRRNEDKEKPKESEGTPKDDEIKESIEEDNLFSQKNKEDNEFEKNPMYSLLARFNNPTEAKNEKNESERIKSNKLNLNEKNYPNTQMSHNQSNEYKTKESQHNNLI